MEVAGGKGGLLAPGTFEVWSPSEAIAWDQDGLLGHILQAQ